MAVIGSISKDLIKRGRLSKEAVGGTVYYSGLTLSRLGVETLVVTKLAKADRGILEDLRRAGVKLFARYTSNTTRCENVYPPDDTDERVQFIPSFSEPISSRDIPEQIATCHTVHLGPLHKSDILSETVCYIKRNSHSHISLDVQGYLREVDSNGRVRLRPWEDKGEVLSAVDVLKADKEEMTVLSETDNIQDGLASIARQYDIPEIVLTCGAKGSVIYHQGEIFAIPCLGPSDGDVTGAGDVFIASYLVARFKNKREPQAAARFASSITTEKIERGLTWLMSR